MSSICSWKNPSSRSSSTSRPRWEGAAREGEQEEGAGCSHPPPGAPGTAAHLRARPGHESSPPGTNHTRATGESLPEIDGTCRAPRAISAYTAPHQRCRGSNEEQMTSPSSQR